MSELRDRILTKALFLNRVEFYVEEWEETVYFQELSGKQLADFAKATYKEVDGKAEVDPLTLMVNLLFYVLVDENGRRLLNKGELKSMNGMTLMKLGTKARELTGLDDITGGIEATEELKKTPVSDSITN